MHNLSYAMHRHGAATARSQALQDHFQTIRWNFGRTPRRMHSVSRWLQLLPGYFSAHDIDNGVRPKNKHANFSHIIINFWVHFYWFFTCYCKRCYFRVTKFSRMAGTKTYSRVVKFALSRCSLVILVLQIFSRVFEFALAEFARNTRKLMYREYFLFYSNWSSKVQGKILRSFTCQWRMSIILKNLKKLWISFGWVINVV